MSGVPEEIAQQPATVASTTENLDKSSNKAEVDQLDDVKAARAEGSRTATKVLEYARIVESQNFRLFALARQVAPDRIGKK